MLVTHDKEEAFDVSDRIAVMTGGAIVQIGDPAEVSTGADALRLGVPWHI